MFSKWTKINESLEDSWTTVLKVGSIKHRQGLDHFSVYNCSGTYHYSQSYYNCIIYVVHGMFSQLKRSLAEKMFENSRTGALLLFLVKPGSRPFYWVFFFLHKYLQALYKGQAFWIAEFFSTASCRPPKKYSPHSFTAERRTCSHLSLAQSLATAIGFNCSDFNCSNPLNPNNNMLKAPWASAVWSVLIISKRIRAQVDGGKEEQVEWN